MKCFHHNDADGRCAGAIVHKARPTSVASDFIEIDYKTDPDLSVVAEGEEVFIVDFSFSQTYMEQLLARTRNVVWIDHHATAAQYPYAKASIAGLRDFEAKGCSGCELTWRYFELGAVPESVELIGDYDSWRLNRKPSCFNFYEGLKLLPHAPCDPCWKRLLDNYDDDGAAYAVAESGKACVEYRDNYCAEMRKAFGYETVLLVNNDPGTLPIALKAYALNVYKFGSLAFGEMMNKYPVCISYVFDGDKYTVGLYSTSQDVDCGKICKQYGGGGHKGAAGFVCRALPFQLQKVG